MLRNICYTLMAGCIVSSVWKMQDNPRQFVPDVEPDVVLETVVSSDAEQMNDLLAWVNTIEKNSGLHPDDRGELFDPYLLAPDFGTPDLMNQLELGMSREEVRSLLGDPIDGAQNDKLWTYDTVRVMFDKNRTQGWVEIDADLTLQAAILKMQPRNERRHKNIESWERRHLRPKRIPAQPRIMRSRVAQKGSSRRSGGFRSSVARLYKALPRARRAESKLYRKPQYLSNMFPSREEVRRDRTSRANRHNGRVTSYRKNSR